MTNLTHEMLKQATMEQAIALRCIRELQPAGGPGDKVFPPTYEGGKYAFEERMIGGEKIPCVLLDSVQSQANRMEQALKTAFYAPGAAKAEIPIIAVDFPGAGLPEIGWITSLDAPHRIADAILRDSLMGDVKFPKSDVGQRWVNSTLADATGLLELCPTSLLFGLWWNNTGGPGNRGNLGTRIQRAVVSEIVGCNSVRGIAVAGQGNPLNITLSAGPLYRLDDGEWYCTKPGQEAYKEVRPSEMNLGGVTPDFAFVKEGQKMVLDDDGRPRVKGGVTIDRALQTTVISLAALRRLHFPVNGKNADAAGWTVLAALGLCAATLAQSDADLRSRCLLVPQGKASWQIVKADGTPETVELDMAGSKALLAATVAEAVNAGLPWRTDVLVLKPSTPLVELVRRSRALQMAQPSED